MAVSLEQRREQNRAAPRTDARGVVPSVRAFGQAIDRQRQGLEPVPLLRAGHDLLLPVAAALEEAEVAALAVEVDDPAAELPRLLELSRACAVPILRTDLLLEEFQVYQSRAAGADAVLLVAAHFEQAALTRLCGAARGTHMAACVLCETPDEVARAAEARAEVFALRARPGLDPALEAALPRRAPVLALPDFAPDLRALRGRADAALDRALAASPDPAGALRRALEEQE